MEVYIVNHLFIDNEYPQDSNNIVWGVFSNRKQAQDYLLRRLRDEVRGMFDDEDEVDEYINDIKRSDDCYEDENEGTNTYNEVNIIEVELDNEEKY